MGSKIYDLEERTFIFAKNCKLLVSKLDKTISNIEDGKQLVKASGSVGANYIEANEKLGNKDYLFRLRISQKEAKESQYWLRLLHDLNESLQSDISLLKEEVLALRKILSTNIKKS